MSCHTNRGKPHGARLSAVDKLCDRLRDRLNAPRLSHPDVEPLEAVEGEPLADVGFFPSGDSDHQGGDGVGIRALHVLPVLAKAFAPDLHVADRGPRMGPAP